MKKSLLLTVAGAIALSANAQVNSGSAVRIERQFQNHQNAPVQLPARAKSSNAANKTTAGSRSYNYVEHMILLDPTVEGNNTLPYMWFGADMYGIYQGTNGLERDTIEFATYGATFDPMDAQEQNFNDPGGYLNEMAVTTQPYVVDSITVWGVYGRNPAKTTIVDTLRFSFVYGNGGTSNMPIYRFWDSPGEPPYWGPNFGYDTTRFAAIFHDTVGNIAEKNGATNPNVVVHDIYLEAGDTTGGLGGFTVPVNMNVPGGNVVGVTVTFRSGEAYTPWSDTVFLGSANPAVPFKYGMFRPLFFEQNDNGYLSYNPNNLNMGHVKFLPDTSSWEGMYVPALAYTAPFGMEFPYIDFHVSCATCPTITSVENIAEIVKAEAYPNPANAEVKIPVTVANGASVEVTLMNTVGQIVATANLGKVAAGQTGTATFNTANLPDGVYIYNVTANGHKKTGKVVVAH